MMISPVIGKEMAFANPRANPAMLQKYWGLYARCYEALRQVDVDTCFVSWLMAVCIYRAMGTGVFGYKSLLLERRLQELPLSSLALRREFITRIQIVGGPRHNLIPRFYFEKEKWALSQGRLKTVDKIDGVDALLQCCRWGMVSMPFQWLPGGSDVKPEHKISNFVRDEQAQLTKLAWKLSTIYGDCEPDVEQMFDRYFERHTYGLTTEDGGVCAALSFGFSELIASAYLPLSPSDPAVVEQ